MKITKLIIALTLCSILISSCSQNERVLSQEVALSDGFEVVVVNKNEANTFTLEKAREVIKNNDSASFILPRDKIKHIEDELIKKERKDLNSVYPFIKLKVVGKTLEKQVIILSFHYSKSTYIYAYEALSKEVKPLWSNYHDFFRNEKTIYK